jgi:hypothetical protein
MGNSKQAKKYVETCQKELTDIVATRSAVENDLQCLKGERLVESKRLAAGKGSESAIEKLDRRIASISARIDGLHQHIADAEQKVREAEGSLREAHERETQEANVFCHAKETEKLAVLRAELPELEEMIKQLYLTLCLTLTKYNTNSELLGITDISPDRFRLSLRVWDALKKEGFVTCQDRGYGSMAPWTVCAAVIDSNPNIHPTFQELAKKARETDFIRWSSEFRREQGWE